MTLTQAYIATLFLLTFNSCLVIQCSRQNHDRSFLRGLIALRKYVIPYTSAVERRLDQEVHIAPNSPYIDWQWPQENGRRIRDQPGYNHIGLPKKNGRFKSNALQSVPTTTIPNIAKSGPPIFTLDDFDNFNSENATIRLSSSYSKVISPSTQQRVRNTSKVSTLPSSHLSVPPRKAVQYNNNVYNKDNTVDLPSIEPNDEELIQPKNYSNGINYSNNFEEKVSGQNTLQNDSDNGSLNSSSLYKVTEESVPNNKSKRHNNNNKERVGLFEIMMSSLRSLPILGNVLKANVDPIYRPLINSIMPATAENRQSTSEEFKEEVHCIESLGCLVTTIDFYDPIFRPINLPPDTRKSINVHYSLFTRSQYNGVPMRPNNINKLSLTSYNPQHKTKFIIHGYLDDQNSTWIKDMVRGLLFNDDCNVFVVDWSGGSRVIYPQAVSNIRVVALEVASVINWAKKEMGQQPELFHVIGHSLGSHSAGYIGNYVDRLGRITGLDPAEPFFQHMPPSVRLDPSDALFVDVIHTDSASIINMGWQFAGYGMDQPIGHVDFYPNGGRGQPGCNSLARIPLTVLQDGTGLSEGLDAAEKEAVACNHIRANKLFTASLFQKCSFMAFPCESFKKFERAECFSCSSPLGCSQLGINADFWKPKGHKHVKMYLSTTEGPDFCQYHYKLTVTLADERAMGGSVSGVLSVTLITDGGELKEFDLTKGRGPIVMRKGRSHNFLLRHSEDLSSSTEALMRWEYEADVFNPLTFCVLFCSTDLEVAALTLTPLDTDRAGGVIGSRDDGISSSTHHDGKDIVMCHKKGLPVIRLESEKTVKVSAEPFCKEIKNNNDQKLLQRVNLN